jgi:hypothetical protein
LLRLRTKLCVKENFTEFRKTNVAIYQNSG